MIAALRVLNRVGPRLSCCIYIKLDVFEVDSIIPRMGLIRSQLSFAQPDSRGRCPYAILRTPDSLICVRGQGRNLLPMDGMCVQVD